MRESDGGSASERTTGEPTGRLRRRLLLDANRWLVAAAVSAGLFGAFVLVGVVDPVPLSRTMQSKTPVESLFQGLVVSIVTAVTLVVTLNQLVLSQELGAVGDQRERVAEAVAFRRDVEEHVEPSVSPVEPAAFLRALVEAARERARSLADAAGTGDGRAPERVRSFVADLERDAAKTNDRLAGAEFGTFAVVQAVLYFDYSDPIYDARRIQADHGDALDEAAAEALEELLAVLELFGPAREHFKTLYFEWDLINLSRAMMYTAVPALVVAASMVVYGDDPGTFAGTILGVDVAVWAVSAAATVALFPFIILLSFVVRIATVAQRTLAAGPFVLQERESADPERE